MGGWITFLLQYKWFFLKIEEISILIGDTKYIGDTKFYSTV